MKVYVFYIDYEKLKLLAGDEISLYRYGDYKESSHGIYAYTTKKKYKKIFEKYRKKDLFDLVVHDMNKYQFEDFEKEYDVFKLDFYYFSSHLGTKLITHVHCCTDYESMIIYDSHDTIAQDIIYDSFDLEEILSIEKSLLSENSKKIFSDQYGIGVLIHYPLVPDDMSLMQSYLNIVYDEGAVYEYQFGVLYKKEGVINEVLEILSDTIKSKNRTNDDHARL